MQIYIDADFKCYTAPKEGLATVETAFFDGMCAAYIEGYRFVPAGQTWTREDGTVFTGEMISPWKPWAELDAAQRAYERERAAALEAQNDELAETQAAMVDTTGMAVDYIYEQDSQIIGGDDDDDQTNAMPT